MADRLVLTKTDLATAEAADRLTQRLRRINPDAPLWRAAEDDLDAEALLSGDERRAPGSRRIADGDMPDPIIIVTPTISAPWRSASTSRSIGRGSASG